jgi:hypothetical protein
MWKTNGDEIFVEDALADAGADGGKYDPTVFELFHTHAEAVEETVNHMLTAVKKSASGEDASEEINATIEAELKSRRYQECFEREGKQQRLEAADRQR